MRLLYWVFLVLAAATGAASYFGRRWNLTGAAWGAEAAHIDFSESHAHKTALVTGGCGGLGEEMVAGLREAGFARVLALCRAGGDVSADLGSLAQVRAAAKKIVDEVGAPHVLVLNAGIWASEEVDEATGVCKTALVNHYAQLLLAELVMGPETRVVVLSSTLHVYGRDMTRDFTLTRPQLTGRTLYGTTKLMNALYAKKLARRGVLAVSVHPGIIRTQLHREENDSSLMTRILPLVWNLIGISRRQGALSTLWAATVPAAQLESGAFYHGKMMPTRGIHPAIFDTALQDLLMKRSRQIVGLD